MAAEFSVYVIELDDAACQRTECAARLSGKGHVYVGETKKDPVDRLAEHKAGGFLSSRVVRKHGVWLRPRLSRNCGPYDTRDESRKAEAMLAEKLRKKGFCVFGGH